MRLLLIIACCCLTIVAFAQPDTYLKKVYTTRAGQTLPYQVLYPKNYTPGQRDKYPLVVVLHGSGERGTDNEKQLVHGSKLFLRDDLRTQYPAIVMFPQCPETDSWTSLDLNTRPIAVKGHYAKQPTGCVSKLPG